jgi:hypothetical protein
MLVTWYGLIVRALQRPCTLCGQKGISRPSPVMRSWLINKGTAQSRLLDVGSYLLLCKSTWLLKHRFVFSQGTDVAAAGLNGYLSA